MDILPGLDDGSFDLILTDPPYGTIKTLSDDTKWDECLPTKEMMNHCHRLLRPKGTLILFSQDPYTTELITNNHGNLPFAYRYIWQKNHFGNARNAAAAPVYTHEDMCVFFKADTDHRAHPLQSILYDELVRTEFTPYQLSQALGEAGAIHHFTQGKVFRWMNRERFGRIQELTGGFDYDWDYLNMINECFKEQQRTLYPKVFNLPNGQNHKPSILTYAKDPERFHPTQKPVGLLEDLIQTYTNVGDNVLDFTMGSGSTGVACNNTGRRFTGIEMNINYYNIAESRILTDSSS